MSSGPAVLYGCVTVLGFHAGPAACRERLERGPPGLMGPRFGRQGSPEVGFGRDGRRLSPPVRRGSPEVGFGRDGRRLSPPIRRGSPEVGFGRDGRRLSPPVRRGEERRGGPFPPLDRRGPMGPGPPFDRRGEPFPLPFRGGGRGFPGPPEPPRGFSPPRGPPGPRGRMPFGPEVRRLAAIFRLWP